MPMIPPSPPARCLRPRRASQMNTPIITTNGSTSTRIVQSDVVLGLVPVTSTLCWRRSGERAVLFRAVGIWEVYAAPLRSFPLTVPAEVMVAVDTLFAVTSLTNPVYVKLFAGVVLASRSRTTNRMIRIPIGTSHIPQRGPGVALGSGDVLFRRTCLSRGAHLHTSKSRRVDLLWNSLDYQAHFRLDLAAPAVGQVRKRRGPGPLQLSHRIMLNCSNFDDS